MVHVNIEITRATSRSAMRREMAVLRRPPEGQRAVVEVVRGSANPAPFSADDVYLI